MVSSTTSTATSSTIRGAGFSRRILFLAAFALFAQHPHHDRDDDHWAIKARLPKTDVRAIRIAAGITDATVGVAIANLDAVTLRRNQILLVDRQGQCIRLHVIERAAKDFKEVWSLTGLTGRGWKMDEISDRPGPGICSQSPRLPSAHATSDGRIVVEVPTLADAFQRAATAETYTFVWDGAKYTLRDPTER